MRRAMVAVLLASVALVGCGKDDDNPPGSSGEPAQGTTTTAAPSSGSTTTAPGTALDVEVVDLAFKPTSLAAKVGSITIAAKKTGSLPHTLTIDELGVSIDLRSSTSGSKTVDAKAGTYTYYCQVHGKATMSGTLTVT